MKKKIIEDVYADYEPATGEVFLMAEHTDGTTETLAHYVPYSGVPSFVKAKEGTPIDATDYQHYYNQALEEAHKKGYCLEDELEEDVEGDQEDPRDNEPRAIIHNYIAETQEGGVTPLVESMMQWMGEDDLVHWFFHQWFAGVVKELYDALGEEKGKIILDYYDDHCAGAYFDAHCED